MKTSGVSAFSIFKTSQAAKKKTEQGKISKKRKICNVVIDSGKKSKPILNGTRTPKKKNQGVVNVTPAVAKEIKGKATPKPEPLKYEIIRSKTPTSMEMQPQSAKRRKSNITVDDNKPRAVVKETFCGNLEAEKCFAWLIYPQTVSDFFNDVWMKEPLHIKRGNSDYFKGLFSCHDFDKILQNNHLEYSKNINIVSYENGKKTEFKADGRAYAPVVWDYFQNGSSIRLLNPQTYSKTIWKLCSLLQEFFGSFVGTNMYLTPADSQGFAPHYDDIEAFVIQLEGRKYWKVYQPRSPSEVLPRYSSPNFSQEEIGHPVLEIVLEPGDLLYFPRGYIHQAKTEDDVHSLHITLSTYQKQTWGDLLKHILPEALETAMSENIDYRMSLPLDYMNYMGYVNKECPERTGFMEKLVRLTSGLSRYLRVDTGTDKVAKDFIHSALPPVLTMKEKECSIHTTEDLWNNGNVHASGELHPDCNIRFIRKRSIRLIREENSNRLYHTFENSRIYKEYEPQYVEIPYEQVPAVELLIEECPRYVTITDLPLKTLEEQMDVATLLYDKGLIETEEPLQNDDDDDDEAV